MRNVYRLILPCLLGLSACSSAQLQFYMLDARLPAPTTALLSAPNSVVGLGPINVPEYADRPQMVSALSANQYRLDDHHRWAEHLQQNLARVLAQALATQLAPVPVVRHPWSERQAISQQVTLDILELHRSADGKAVLNAQWGIKGKGQTLAETRRFNCALPVPADDYEALVSAQSQCLGMLGADIAGRLRQLLVAGKS